jgi:ABC-type glycerol-3-phosphate transport system substrate-binding protein
MTFNLASCSSDKGKTAILWSDRPEFALYAEYFNAAQDQYRVETLYHEFPAQKLMENGAPSEGNPDTRSRRQVPDIVAGSWLKSVSTRAFFKPLDRHFRNKTLIRSDFYPRLLAMGNIDGKQYLLPISFNAPMVIFSRENREQISSPFTIDFAEMKQLGKEYNAQTRGVYTRMGFSPTWDNNFLFITATLFDASFKEQEAGPIAWNSNALEKSMDFVYAWNSEANTNMQTADDFTFKYLYDPPAKLVLSGRILFTCMDSDRFFTLAEDQQNNLDFRWIAEEDTIPLAEGTVYLGLAKKGKAPKAAAAFLRWFLSADTQRAILERSRQNRMFETSFGISGGFSAMRPVTEQIFPQFYLSLLGHIPPADFLSPPNILPMNWMALKERVVLPYLHDRARQTDQTDIYELENRLADWRRMNH